ncbi:MAG: hypothetical protein ABI793_11145 [Flavobacterium sp.]
MKYIYNKPYFLFFALVTILLAVILANCEKRLILNIRDTYFVVSYLDFGLFLSFSYGLLGLIYYALIRLNFSLIKWMTVVHVIISIGGLFLIFGFFLLIREAPSADLKSFLRNMNFNSNMNLGILISFICVIGAQVLFVVNGIHALVKGKA